MNTLMTSYTLFSEIFCNEKPVNDKHLSFESVCRMIDADPVRLDDLLREELGMSGEDILSRI